jgi:cystathionine beta-synthase
MVLFRIIAPAILEVYVRNVHDNILTCVGNTPIVRLNRLGEGLKANIMVKLEMMNPGGSIKDRIALKIIDDAEQAGELTPGSTIVEGTSGNTGAGLAMVAAIRGYHTTFVMPDKQSEEKRAALRAYGSRVVITPTAVEPEDPTSYYSVSDRLGNAEGAFFANQYHNPSNPQTHYESTGPEIYEQLDGKIDVLVCGMGTGGTISGIGRYLKEKNPNIKIVGVDPIGSLYYDYFHTGQMTEAHSYVVEGIGEDFMPTTVEWEFIDDVVRVNDKECFQLTRRIVREEGIFCGGSSGAAVAGALRWVRNNDAEGLNVLVILPDSGSRYLSKIFNESWMKEGGYLAAEASMGFVRDLMRTREENREMVCVKADATVTEVVGLLKLHGISQLPVVTEENRLLGLLTESALLSRALSGGSRNARVGSLVQANFCSVTAETEITLVTNLFARSKVAFILDADDKLVDIITRIDLIDYISKKAGGAK